MILVVVITVSHWYDFDRKSLTPAVVLEMHCRNSYPINGVKCTRVGPTLLAGEILMEGRLQTDPEPDRVLAQRSQVVVNV